MSKSNLFSSEKLLTMDNTMPQNNEEIITLPAKYSELTTAQLRKRVLFRTIVAFLLMGGVIGATLYIFAYMKINNTYKGLAGTGGFFLMCLIHYVLIRAPILRITSSSLVFMYSYRYVEIPWAKVHEAKWIMGIDEPNAHHPYISNSEYKQLIHPYWYGHAVRFSDRWYHYMLGTPLPDHVIVFLYPNNAKRPIFLYLYDCKDMSAISIGQKIQNYA